MKHKSVCLAKVSRILLILSISCMFLIFAKWYMLLRDCEMRKAEAVVRAGIVALNKKDKIGFSGLLSENFLKSFSSDTSLICGVTFSEYRDFRREFGLDIQKYDLLQVGYIDMNFMLSSAKVYMNMGVVPNKPLPHGSLDKVFGVFSDEERRHWETLNEWLDGQMTLVFDVKNENGVWRLLSYPVLVCR